MINELLADAQDELKAYLLNHESDIAYGINDYGDLVNVFIGVLGREPELEGNKYEL